MRPSSVAAVEKTDALLSIVEVDWSIHTILHQPILEEILWVHCRKGTYD